MSASAVPPSSPSLSEAMPSPGFPAGFNEAMHADFEDAAQHAQAAWWSGYGTGSQQYTGYIHIHW
ncbi:MAG: hypothetical protein OXH08_04175 [Gammaproteobacteria bacterium]|nr:hypothetical protein [Gammaproteobacteria bacterium]MDE0652007.1 hypothetical protein [Gammaproteobacteria bacterium]